jgi:DNA-directed RNA polymerase specialized sigma24 family protein
MDPWVAELQRGRSDAAWDLFLDRYRRLIFAAIRHYAQDYDDVMDVFAHACESLREADLKRLRSYFEQPSHSARFSTWLVTVVRHPTVDWFRTGTVAGGSRRSRRSCRRCGAASLNSSSLISEVMSNPTSC